MDACASNPLCACALCSARGILGCGSVGQQVARLAKPFGSKVVYNNRRRLPEALEDELGIEFVPFDTLLRVSDVVSVNVPLTDETRGLIGEVELAHMKKGAILVARAKKRMKKCRNVFIL